MLLTGFYNSTQFGNPEQPVNILLTVSVQWVQTVLCQACVEPSLRSSDGG